MNNNEWPVRPVTNCSSCSSVKHPASVARWLRCPGQESCPACASLAWPCWQVTSPARAWGPWVENESWHRAQRCWCGWPWSCSPPEGFCRGLCISIAFLVCARQGWGVTEGVVRGWKELLICRPEEMIRHSVKLSIFSAFKEEENSWRAVVCEALPLCFLFVLKKWALTAGGGFAALPLPLLQGCCWCRGASNAAPDKRKLAT